MTFPIRPRHIPGEPASGYARRLAEANGCDWRSNPFASRGVSTTLLARGDTRALVPFLGRGMVDGIDRYSPRRMRDGHISLNGEKLEPAQVFYERQRYCVACWADDAAGETGGQFPMRHLRCWWSVAAVTVCPIHNVRLNDRCLQCDRTIRLAGGRVTVCRCGANLAQSTRIVVDAHATAADTYVVGRLGGCSRVPHAILDTLPLCDAIALMQRLGCCVSAGRDARFGKTDPRSASNDAGRLSHRPDGRRGHREDDRCPTGRPGQAGSTSGSTRSALQLVRRSARGRTPVLDGNPHRERRQAESAELAGLGAACRRTTDTGSYIRQQGQGLPRCQLG